VLAAIVICAFMAVWLAKLPSEWRSREPFSGLGWFLGAVLGDRVGKAVPRAAVGFFVSGLGLTLVLVAVAAQTEGLISQSKQSILVSVGSAVFVVAVLLIGTLAVARWPRSLVPPRLRARKRAAPR
jgi:hypothetical protein